MAVTTTTLLDNSVRAQYHDKYIQGAKARRLYDLFAMDYPRESGEGFLGTSFVLPFLNDIAPAEGTISQVADITPVALSDVSGSVTPTSVGNAIQISELLKASAFTNFNSKVGGYYEKVGNNLMESLELLAKKVALAGTWVNRAAARASLNAGTNDMTYANLQKDAMLMVNTKAPMFDNGAIGKRPMAIANSLVSKDLIAGSSEPLLSVSQYQDKSYLINGELGMLAGVRLVFSPWGHIFHGAGTTNGTSVVTTLNGAVTAGATTCTLTTVGSLAAGMHLTVGSIETAATLYPTTERVEVASVSGSVATIIGSGPNGGFRFDHADLSVASNSDDVATVLYGGPESLGKVYASNIHGPMGKIVEPDVTGMLEQFFSLGFKFYGNYGIIAQNRLLRREVSLSVDA